MIPTILLTGFLGAGKTTLLNRLIEHYKSQQTVLLINEFGKVGIDGDRIIHDGGIGEGCVLQIADCGNSIADGLLGHLFGDHKLAHDHYIEQQ